MKLYVCWGTWRGGDHACGTAHHALISAGFRPAVVRSYGSRYLPDVPFNLTPGRREVKRLTGSSTVPTLALDDGQIIDGSDEIVRWARANRRA
jgi:hypothetical protein